MTMVYIYRNASKCYNNVAEFKRSVQPLKCISIYAISIIYWKKKQQCNQLLSNNGNGKTNSSATSFNMKNCSTEQKLCNQKGSRVKKLHCKKLCCKKSQQIHNEKCCMCEWDH